MENNKDKMPAEIQEWLAHPMTRRFRTYLLEYFDHQSALLAATPGATVDRYYGRAEVLEFVRDPKQLFDLNSQ